mgnify:CR=1 FL=1
MNYYLSAVLATLIWGASGIFVASIDLNVLNIIFFRCLIPSLFSACFLFKNKNILLLQKKEYFFISLLSLLTLIFQFYAYKLAPVSLATVLFYCWPLLYYVFGILVKQETFIPPKIILCFFGFLGIIFINLDPNIDVGKPFSSKSILMLDLVV